MPGIVDSALQSGFQIQILLAVVIEITKLLG